VIANFTASDAVNLSGYGGNDAARALAGAVSAGGNTSITLTDNTQITFLSVGSPGALAGHVFSV